MIRTPRLDLIPNSTASLRACLDGRDALAAALGTRVPETWPPDLLDPPALRFVLERLEQAPAEAEWWMYFVVLRVEGRRGILVGSAGYKGPPAPDGTVEIGYSIVGDRRRKGYASEAVRALLERAFAFPEVRRVIAETLPELVPSIGVLEKCGFAPVGAGSDPGSVRYALRRAEFAARGSRSARV